MILAKTKKLTKQLTVITASLLLAMPLLYFQTAISYAEPLSARSVTIGSSIASVNTNHQFKFTVPSFSSLGSIEFEYCSNTPFAGTACTAPAGLSVAGATLTAQSGENGFSVDPSTTANRFVLTRTAIPSSGLPASYSLNNIINPSQTNSTVYVRVSTFATEDATGPRTDDGAVVFSTASNIAVNGFVPPYLTFCVGVTVEINCSSTTGSLLNFGELVTTQTRALASQYSGSTNDPGGFSTTVAGVTMTSGNNFIPALESPSVSRTGLSQFGMNLRANSNPGIGNEPDGPGTSTPAGEVGVSNRFYFKNQVISSSPISTDFKRFTAAYMVNVASSQRPGIYSTTLTYIATAAF